MLRLMEDFHQHQVEQTGAEALRLGAISFDAVKMLLLARLRSARRIRAYLGLITGASVMETNAGGPA